MTCPFLDLSGWDIFRELEVYEADGMPDDVVSYLRSAFVGIFRIVRDRGQALEEFVGELKELNGDDLLSESVCDIMQESEWYLRFRDREWSTWWCGDIEEEN